MADKLVWVKFKNGKRREIASHIAHDKNHQKSHGFLPEAEATADFVEEPQKKIVTAESENPVAEKNDVVEVAQNIEEQFAGLDTQDLTQDLSEEVTEVKEKTPAGQTEPIAKKKRGKKANPNK